MVSTAGYRRAVAAMVISVWASPAAVGAQPPSASVENGEWPVYHGNLAQHHYSPLDQITARNFDDLEVAWTFKTDNLGTRPEFKLVGTPLMVGGRLYRPAARDVRWWRWMRPPASCCGCTARKKALGGAASPRQLSGRGLAYWSDGTDARILYITPGFRLVALDARTGLRIPAFGDEGLIDLKAAAVYGVDQPIDPVTGEIGLHATPTVAGSARNSGDGATPRRRGPGLTSMGLSMVPAAGMVWPSRG